MQASRLNRTAPVMAIGVGCVLLGLLASTFAFDAPTTRLAVYLAMTLLVAGSAWRLLVRPQTLQPSLAAGLPAGIVIVQAVAFTVLATGQGTHLTFGFAAHQIAWALGGAIVVAWIAFKPSGHGSFPPWLIAYAVALGVGAAVHPAAGAIYDVGLSVLAVGSMWQLAVMLSGPGGVMTFLKWVAYAYWSVLAAAMLVEYGHVSLGMMTPDLVQLPWQGSLANIFSTGNQLGYGAITVQGGRELGAVVFVYHFIRWRETQDVRQGVGALLAGIVFLTAYGRIPFIGGLIAIIVVVATMPGRGLSRRALVAMAIPVMIVALTPGVGDALVAKVSEKRVGQNSLDTGHLSLWTQHLDLFLLRPVNGVGAAAAPADIVASHRIQVFHPASSNDLTAADLFERGSRGEGGWTAILAQRGILGAGLVFALLFGALRSITRQYPAQDLWARQDLTALRALLPAMVLWFVTDIPPLGVYTFSAFVSSMLVLMAVAQSNVRSAGRAPQPERERAHPGAGWFGLADTSASQIAPVMPARPLRVRVWPR